MTPARAKKFALDHFPNGPETLAQHLDISVRLGPLIGCDGWVLSGESGTVIRLNDASAPSRRRFTLAHELGHLLLEVPTIIGETIEDSLRSNNAEERQVNELAAELLLPTEVVKRYVNQLPVVAEQIRRLAKVAKVSDIAAAIRVVNLAPSIGLLNASVAFFQNGKLEWSWSQTLEMPADTVVSILADVEKSHPKPLRIHRKKTDDVIVASQIENPIKNSKALFVQLLPSDVGVQMSKEELRKELEAFLFANDNDFRMSLQGVFGSFRPKLAAMSLDAAVEEFFDKKSDRWTGSRRARLLSDRGREYVRLRLSDWCEE